MHPKVQIVYDRRAEDKTLIFDLDGTLALCEHRRHWLDESQHPELSADERWRNFFADCVHDTPNHPVCGLLRILQAYFKIVIFSGRSAEVRSQTEAWLRYYKVVPDELWMREAGAHTPDHELKQSWLEQYGKDKIYAVFDDRNSVVEMWRKNGIACMQVAEGNF